MPKSNLPPNVYLQSYLRKAGIRFEVNTVDTICRRGVGISFYIVFIIFAFIWVLKISGQLSSLPHARFILLISAVSVYLLYYLLRLAYYNRKSKILKNNRMPIAAEAYAIVILDEVKSIFPWSKMRKSAVLYKETGSMQPRFFTGPIRYGLRQHYHKNQIAKIFIDRKDPKIYTVDDIHAHQTVSKKLLGPRLSINDLDRSSFKVKQN